MKNHIVAPRPLARKLIFAPGRRGLNPGAVNVQISSVFSLIERGHEPLPCPPPAIDRESVRVEECLSLFSIEHKRAKI